MIRIRRIYEAPDGGCRILADRLWPRGIKKEAAALNFWAKETAPSAALRKWFGHDPAKWEAFGEKYRDELAGNPKTEALVEYVRARLAEGDVVLLYGAKDEAHNNAVLLKSYLEARIEEMDDCRTGDRIKK